MSLTDPTPRYCDYCGSKFSERYPGQRFCRPWCRNEGGRGTLSASVLVGAGQANDQRGSAGRTQALSVEEMMTREECINEILAQGVVRMKLLRRRTNVRRGGPR